MARGAIHPVEHLAEQLEALAMSAAELSRQPMYPRTGLARSSRASVQSPVRPCCDSVTSSKTARSSGSASRPCTSCAARNERSGRGQGLVKALPALSTRRTASAGRHAQACSSAL